MLLFEELATHCFTAGIPFVVDSGTLLGCIRHYGIIPWDDDGDLALLAPDYRRLCEQFVDTPTMRLARDYWSEPDGACAILPGGGEEDIAIDLVAYDADGRTRMTEGLQAAYPIDCYKEASASESSHRYDFGAEDLAHPALFPFFSGLVQAPRDWQARLMRQYDDLEVPAERRAFAESAFPFPALTPPVVPVAEFASLEEGLAKTGGSVPFLVPRCSDFAIDAARFAALLARETELLHGHARLADGSYEDRSAKPSEAFARFRAGTLGMLVSDSPISNAEDVFPDFLRRRQLRGEGDYYARCWVLGSAPSITDFHVDPDFGGGFMHLVEGEKFWWFIDPADAPIETLESSLPFAKAGGGSIADLLTRDDFRLWGKIRVAHHKAGGCVYFPPNWSHRVFTYRDAFGVGGYA
jgi:hypothetical protein